MDHPSRRPIFDEPGWSPAWRALVEPRWGGAAAAALASRLGWDGVDPASDGAVRLPPRPQVFAALAPVSPSGVRVVICGQDPYHGPGVATGLAFSIRRGNRLPPSLRNILRELSADLPDLPDPAAPAPPPDPAPALDATDLLAPWAAQGVLLLNQVLTVPPHTPGGHRGIGWEALTDAIFVGLCDLPGPRVFLLWGQQASGLSHHIHRPEHLVLQAPHPSPLSAYRGFFGSRPFGQTNAWLTQHGLPPIRWHLDPLGGFR